MSPRPSLSGKVSRAGAALFLTILAGLAQTPTARIGGSILDPTGKAIAGARITTRNLATGNAVEARSNEQGIYSVPFLNPGRYSMQVAADGFQTHLRNDITLDTAQTLALEVMLQLGDVTQTVTVSESTPLLRTADSSVGQLIENATVANMPLASRRSASLVRLLPNVTYSGEDSRQGFVQFSIAGGRGQQQIWQLDGGNMQGNATMTGIVTHNPPVEALQEFKVEAVGYPAEYGRTMGGFISMTTKSGTNQFHGALYEFLRNDAFDARSFFAPSVAPRKYNVFGGTIGGPVKKDKTHFFFSYEGTRRRDGITRTYSVPTQQEVRGDFSAKSGTLLDPTNRQPFAGKVIPASRLDPVGSKLAALYAEPNVAGAASGANNFRRNVVTSNNEMSIIGRIDHVLSASDRITGRWAQFRNRQQRGAATPVAAADPNAGPDSLDNWNVTVSWLHSVGPTLFNDMRFTAAWRDAGAPVAIESGIAQQVGLKGADPKGMPQVTVAGLTTMGLGNQDRRFQYRYPTQIIDTISWFKGKHTVKVGGEWRRSPNYDLGGSTRFGALGFNDVPTGPGFGLASLLLGWTNTANVVSGLSEAKLAYFAGFIQDDYKITSRLSLNIGLRWDMDTPRIERYDRQNGFDALAINPVSGTPGVLTFARRDGVSRYAHDFDKNNFAPRFGFAWRPIGDRTVIRGAYGIMQGPIYDTSMANVMMAGFGQTRSFSSPDNGLTPAFPLSAGFPEQAAVPIGPGFGAVAAGQPVTLSPEFVDKNYKNTYAHHISFNIQHQLPGNLLLDVGYLGNLAHNVGSRSTNINEIRPELRGAAQNQRLRPFPQFGNVSLVQAAWGNSAYNGFSVKVEKRFSAGLNLLSSYTWAKFLDDVEAQSEAGGAPGSGIQSYYARALDKSFSGNDVRHRWVTSFVYELPIGRDKHVRTANRVLDAVAGGWSLGMISELRSGLPYGVAEQTNRLNAFSPAQRPNRIQDQAIEGGRSRAELVRQYFNTAAFAAPAAGTLGTSARNVGHGPGMVNFEMSLLKAFHLTESKYLQLRGEFFNVLNRPNFGLPNTSRGNAAFGQIGSTVNDGRFIQIGLRFVY